MSTITHDPHLSATRDGSRGRQPTAVSPATSPMAVGRLDAALAVLRVIVGTVFVAHGAQKLFVFGLGGVIGAFEGMGVPFAGIAGPAVAFIELFAGLALIAGLFTRVAASAVAGVMLGAAVLVHAPAGFFLPNGAEFVLTLFGVAVALVLAGPGSFSADGILAHRREER